MARSAHPPSSPRSQGRAVRGAARRLVSVAYRGDAQAARRVRLLRALEHDQTADELLDMDGRPASADRVFDHLRWGGRVLTASRHAGVALDMAHRYRDHGGFVVEAGPNTRRIGPGGIPWLGPPWHYVLARKIHLIKPGEYTDRFTFDVRLTRNADVAPGYLVCKTVPTYKRVIERLREKFPKDGHDTLLRRAEKLVKRVFPVFLTREAAFLQLLQRDLPPQYRNRVPRALAVEKAPDGTVKKLYMTWLRLGGQPLGHLEFAEQSAELLHILHSTVGIMHLDLRLDNMVISNGQVCFVDFGSAVRLGEDLDKSPLLRSLFHEMMQTSQIQRTLGKMRETGHLTSDVLIAAHGRVDPGVDLFYLALQLGRPYWNPDLVPFIDYREGSEAARRLKRLADAILRPTDRTRTAFMSAKDMLGGVRKIRQIVGE